MIRIKKSMLLSMVEMISTLLVELIAKEQELDTLRDEYLKAKGFGQRSRHDTERD